MMDKAHLAVYACKLSTTLHEHSNIDHNQIRQNAIESCVYQGSILCQQSCLHVNVLC